MANLDTAAKRASGLRVFARPFSSVLVAPDATVAQGDRQSVVWMYSAILAGATVVAFSGPVPTQTGTVGNAHTLSLGGYFSGSQTPFTYAVQTEIGRAHV